MIGTFLTAAILLAQAAPAAQAATPPAASAPAPASANVVSPVTVERQKDAEAQAKEVVCHSEPVLGSLFPKKVCASRQAIAERRREDQAQVREWVALKPLKSN